MQKFKSSVAAAVLSVVGLSAHAISAVSDDEMGSVTGQDGVTIGGDLNINIGAFTWTDTDADGGLVSFNNISVKGMFVQTIDVLNAGTIVPTIITTMQKYISVGRSYSEAYKLTTETFDVFGASLGPDSYIYDGVGDVVQFAFPNAKLDSRLSPTIKIASITNGNSTKSYGSLEIRNIDMQGTKIWLWAH